MQQNQGLEKLTTEQKLKLAKSKGYCYKCLNEGIYHKKETTKMFCDRHIQESIDSHTRRLSEN